jgi:hypothetical protein
MDFLAELLNGIPNKNAILIELSERYSGNSEYIKDFRTPIMQEIVHRVYKEDYMEQHLRGTISLRLVAKNIEKDLGKRNLYLSSHAIRGILSK